MSRRGIRQESKKHVAEREERSAVVRAVFARDRGCVAKHLVPLVRCSGPIDPHEVIPRSAWRKGYLVMDNIISVCRAHHDWIDENPDHAAERGLHGYSWQVPK